MSADPAKFWSLSAQEALGALDARPAGLSDEEAAGRLRRYGPNTLKPRRRYDRPPLYT